MEFAIVYEKQPTKVVLTTGEPFEADSQQQATKEVCETFAEQEEESAYDFLTKQGWQVVPITSELKQQYERTSNCPRQTRT